MEYFADVSAEERAEILSFCNYVKEQMHLQIPENDGVITGDFVDFVIGGSWANGTADEFSDYDIFFVLDKKDAFATPEDPRLARAILRHLIRYDQQNFELSHYVDGAPIQYNMYTDYPGNSIFGVSLLTGAIYNQAGDLANAFSGT